MTGPRAERRLAAVLAADAVGYSRMMGVDETGTRARFNENLDTVIGPLIAIHKGRLVKELGDGLLVEFASVVDAVECAIAIQDAMPAFNEGLRDDQHIIYRIGVNLGDVIIEGDDIHGDGVNVAARLEALAEPGGVCLSRAARDQIRDRLDVALTDLGEVEVKNIVRPVRVFAIGGQSAKPPIPARPAPGSARPRRLIGAALALLLAALGFAVWQLAPSADRADPDNMAFPLPDQPSLAVMPFRAVGADEDVGILAEALAQDVAAKLARVSGLFVISSNATFAYGDRTVSPKVVAEELGVRNVVTGLARQTSDGVSVAVEIVDAISGQTVFSGDFAGRTQSFFELQEEVASAIARELAVNLPRTAASGRATASAEAYLLWYRGARFFNEAPRPDTMSAARALAQRSLALDPGFGRAQALMAYLRTQEGYFRFVDDWRDALDEGYELGKLAVEAAPDDWYAHEALAFATMNLRRYEEALAVFDKAIDLAPAQPTTLTTSALPLLFLGRPDEALKRLRTAKRLNPFHNWNVPQFMGMGHYMKEDYEAALVELETSARLNPNFIGNLLWRAATHGQLGQRDKAAEAVDAILKINPKATVAGGFIQISDPAIMARFEEGLRKAGLPE